MSPILLSFTLLLVGFVILIKGADLLVSGASSFARRLRISELTIGLTVVAFGTSAPEMVVNVISNIENHAGVVFGNIIGSNIFNLSVILGVAGLIYPITVQQNTKWKEIPYSIFGVLLVFILGNDILFRADSIDSVSFVDGIILLLFFALFLFYVYRNMRKGVEQSVNIDPVELISKPKTHIYILLGLAGLVLGGKLVVDNAVELAYHFNMTEKIIGLTIVAAGTSLPELATSAVAAYKRQSDIAVGNIIGSNIFNIFLVLGVTALIRPLLYDSSVDIDLMVTAGLTVFLFGALFVARRNILDRVESIILLLLFIAYMVYLVLYSGQAL